MTGATINRQVTSTNRREPYRTRYPISGGFLTAYFHLWSEEHFLVALKATKRVSPTWVSRIRKRQRTLHRLDSKCGSNYIQLCSYGGKTCSNPEFFSPANCVIYHLLLIFHNWMEATVLYYHVIGCFVWLGEWLLFMWLTLFLPNKLLSGSSAIGPIPFMGVTLECFVLRSQMAAVRRLQ